MYNKFILNLLFLQVPLSVCSTVCPPGMRKAMRPNFPVCCYDCVACADGEITNLSGENIVFNAFNCWTGASQ